MRLFFILTALLLVSCNRPNPIPEKISLPEKIRLLENKALKGDPDAQYQLGEMLYKGAEVQRNDSEAFRWFRLAAEQNYPLALNRLGLIYHHGLGGIKADDEEAAFWFRKAASQGLAEAQYNLGVMLDGTHKINENIPEMMSLFKSAADQGYPPAQFSYGSLMAISQSDPVTAYVYLQLAAMNKLRGTTPYLENLQKKMTSQQLAEAKRRIQSEKEKQQKK